MEHIANVASDVALWFLATAAAAVVVAMVAAINCAVCEGLVRVAAWMYSSSPDLRAIRREEWLAAIADMKPLERPGQAGSYLWVGLKRCPGWLPSRRARDLAPMSVFTSVEQLRSFMLEIAREGKPLTIKADGRVLSIADLTAMWEMAEARDAAFFLGARETGVIHVLGLPEKTLGLPEKP